MQGNDLAKALLVFAEPATLASVEGYRWFLRHGANVLGEDGSDKLDAEPDREELTDREREVLALIAAGHQNAAIGEQLFISPKTVEKHRASLMAKLGVNSVSGLLTYALREGLLDEHRQL